MTTESDILNKFSLRYTEDGVWKEAFGMGAIINVLKMHSFEFSDWIAKERSQADYKTLETVAMLLNGDDNQLEVVKNYVRNKLLMYNAQVKQNYTTNTEEE